MGDPSVGRFKFNFVDEKSVADNVAFFSRLISAYNAKNKDKPADILQALMDVKQFSSFVVDATETQIASLYEAKGATALSKAFLAAGASHTTFAANMAEWLKLRRRDMEPAPDFVRRATKSLTQLYPTTADEHWHVMLVRDQLVRSLPLRVQAEAVVFIQENNALGAMELALRVDARLRVEWRLQEGRFSTKGGKGVSKGEGKQDSKPENQTKQRRAWLPREEFLKKKEAERARKEKAAAAEEIGPEQEYAAFCTIMEAAEHEVQGKNEQGGAQE